MSTPAASSKQLRLCLVGYGFTAKTLHIPLIKRVPGLRIQSVVQRHPSPGNSAAEDLGVKVYSDWKEAVEDGEVDIVVIMTGNQTHYEITKAALQAGKHVLVEKPFTTDYKQALELVQLAKEKNLVLTVYHNRRLDSDYLTLRILLQDPARPLGPVHEVLSCFNRYKAPTPTPSGKAWKIAKVPGNGLSWDLGIHLVDQALQLFGMPDRVWGYLKDRSGAVDGAKFGEEGFQDDWFVAGMEYDAGRKGWAKAGGVVRIEAGVMKAGTPLRYEVQGELGSYLKSGMDQQEEHLKSGAVPGDQGFGADPEELQGTLVLPNSTTEKYAANQFGGYITIYENLRDVINNGAELIVPPAEAAEAVRIVELIGRSSNEGRTLSTAL